MFQNVIWLSIACAAFLQVGTASPTFSQRQSRSFWPFASSPSASEALISEENAFLLQEAGLSKALNLSSHPLWKIHKYQGIDLKPVHIQTEIIKSSDLIDGRNVATEPPNTPSASTALPIIDAVSEINSKATTELPDLSFLDDLGGLAYFLPEPSDGEDEATELIADAIKKEEEYHPGFFKNLWWKIWGAPTVSSEVIRTSTKAPTEQETEATKSEAGFFSSIFSFGQSYKPKEAVTAPNDSDEALTIYLPETQGSYVAIVVPPEQQQKTQLVPVQDAPMQTFQEKETEKVPLLFEANPTSQHREATTGQEAAVQKPIQVMPLAPRPAAPLANSNLSSSKAWIQSWTPHASYSVHVQGPLTNLQAPQIESGTYSPVLSQDSLPVLEAFENNQEQSADGYQRKISQGEIEEADESTTRSSVKGGQVSNSSKEQIVQSENVLVVEPVKKSANSNVGAHERKVKNLKRDELDRARDILSSISLPEGLMKRLQVSQQDVDAILNDKDSAIEAAARLRQLQREFEMRKEQMSYAYSNVRKQNTK